MFADEAMIPATPSAIQAPWRRSTRPAASGVLASLTTTMPSVPNAARRSSSRAGCSMAGISAQSAETTATPTSTTRSVSVVVNASHPVVPDAVVNSRLRRRKNCSTGPCTSPIRVSSGGSAGVGAYHDRPSAATRPIAAAMMKRTLERKPMVRMGRWLLIGTRWAWLEIARRD